MAIPSDGAGGENMVRNFIVGAKVAWIIVGGLFAFAGALYQMTGRMVDAHAQIPYHAGSEKMVKEQAARVDKSMDEIKALLREQRATITDTRERVVGIEATLKNKAD